MGMMLQVIWQSVILCIIGAALAVPGSSGFGEPLSVEFSSLTSPVEAQAPSSIFEPGSSLNGSILQPLTVTPSTKSPPFYQGSKGPPPFLSPRRSTALPPEHGLAPSLSAEPPHDSAFLVAKPPHNLAPPLVAATPFEQPKFSTPPPVSDSPHYSAVAPVTRAPKDATPAPVTGPSHASAVPQDAKPPVTAAPLPIAEPPQDSTLKPPVEAQPYSSTPPPSEASQRNSTMSSPPVPSHVLSPVSQLGPSHASSATPIVLPNASVQSPLMLPLPLEPPLRSTSPPLADAPPLFEPPLPAVADPPLAVTTPFVVSPSHFSPLPPGAEPPHASSLPLAAKPPGAASPLSAVEPPPLSASSPPADESPLFEPPPPAAADPSLVLTPPFVMSPSHTLPLPPGAEPPHAPSLPLAPKTPDAASPLPVAEPPQELPLTPPPESQPVFTSPPPASAMQPPPMPQNASSAGPQLAPPTASSPLPHMAPPITLSPLPQLAPQNASHAPPQLAPPVTSPPLSQLVPPIASSPLPQLPPQNASSSPPQQVSHASPQTPVAPSNTAFPPPLMEPPPMETPPIVPSPSSPVPSNASSPPPEQVSHASPQTPVAPPNTPFPPPLMEPPPMETPPSVPSPSSPVPSNASSLPPQLGPPYASLPPPQVVTPSASPPASPVPSNSSLPPPSMVPPFVQPPPLLPSASPAVPPHDSAILSPPMPSHALSPMPLLVPPHSPPPPLAEPPHVFSSPPPIDLPRTSPPSSINPGAVPPHASSPLHFLTTPFAPPPPAMPSHGTVPPPLMVPPPSELSHSSFPPSPATERTVPARPPHSSQRNEAQHGAPPPFLTSPEPSHSSRSPRVAPPVEQDKSGFSPPISPQIMAPKQSAPLSRSNASEPHTPSLPAPAPSNGLVRGRVQPAAPPGRAPEQLSPANLSPLHASPVAMVPSSSPPGIPKISPAHSPIPRNPPVLSGIPFPSPKISPSGSSTRNTKRPLTPPIRSLPPPPPNSDCAYLTCPEPYTNTPPGSPCACVWPMQVGLRLDVPLYTFFPLVSELAREISIGVFLKQSQVRVMGANAATQEPEKTIVLADLVPLDDKFGNITSLLIFQKFWHKQVVIDKSMFGDYDVLYVRYPGLPPSPPMAPADIAVINGMPYSVGDPNGSKMHPLGVDVTKQRHGRRVSAILIAVIVFLATLGFLICCSITWFLVFRHTNSNSQPTQAPRALPSLSRSPGPTGLSTGSGQSSSLSFGSSLPTYTGSAKTFSASEMEKATDNFNPSRIVGEGGFGLVYGGVLEDETRIAVKVLKRDDQQGGREFLAEVEMLTRLHHRNLVKLIGICTDERIRCLVYELIPNGSVDSHLHGPDRETAPLDWASRLKIALGAARGLAYLHEDSSPRVIHRDFKSSNILLENDFTPKVSDFGLARTAMDEEHRHISTRVMGTFGYVAPEYAMTGHLLVKSDVYSYGVVLLELLTGRKPVDMSQPAGQENLVTWTRPLLTSKEGLESIIDLSLGSDVPFQSVAKVAAIASMCVQPEVSHRPFMGEVVQALKLVCNECDDSRDGDSRSNSRENLSMDFDAKVGPVLGTPDPLEGQFPLHTYAPGHDVEKGLSVSEIFSTSATLDRQASDSSRRHSSSGPIRPVRGLRSWQRIRRLSHGSVSEHGIMYRLWAGSH